MHSRTKDRQTFLSVHQSLNYTHEVDRVPKYILYEYICMYKSIITFVIGQWGNDDMHTETKFPPSLFHHHGSLTIRQRLRSPIVNRIGHCVCTDTHTLSIRTDIHIHTRHADLRYDNVRSVERESSSGQTFFLFFFSNFLKRVKTRKIR